MDPNANLQEQEWIITESFRDEDGLRTDRARLRELRQALAGWLTNGGFRPTNVAECPNAAKYYRGTL